MRQFRRRTALALDVEGLETRLALSLLFGAEARHDGPAGADARPGGGTGPAIELDLVALHEFGHSLGLPHIDNVPSIMNSYYNANYNLANFSSDPAVAQLQSRYANGIGNRWSDLTPNNSTIDLTYSFVPDGTRMDSGRSNLFSTFNGIFGAESTWQGIFVAELNRWAGATGLFTFTANTDSGASFGFSGADQGDSRAGDIRISAHRFDGAGKVLAHAYFPPPNSGTGAGDAHFDSSENWIYGQASATASAIASAGASTSTTGAGGLGVGSVDDLRFGQVRVARAGSPGAEGLVAVPPDPLARGTEEGTSVGMPLAVRKVRFKRGA